MVNVAYMISVLWNLVKFLCGLIHSQFHDHSKVAIEHCIPNLLGIIYACVYLSIQIEIYKYIQRN